MSNYDIGVGITTHNRKEVCMDTVERIRAMSPVGTHVIVVDDASVDPPPFDFRFKRNVGIAKAKNKCLELLQEHDHIFLFDDDCYPTSPQWFMPYVESKYPHLSYTFSTFSDGRGTGNKLKKREGKHIWYEHACGCMLYIRKETLDTLGGFDTRFGLYGHEHINYSKRAHLAGLIPHPFIDIRSPQFYSYDQHSAVTSSLAKNLRRYFLRRNKHIPIDKIKHNL